MAVNPLYTPGELEYLRAFRQGQVPDVGLLGDPAAPEATYADLYGPAPVNDPGAGLPPEAIAGPPVPVSLPLERDVAAERADRDADIAAQAQQSAAAPIPRPYDPAFEQENKVTLDLPRGSVPVERTPTSIATDLGLLTHAPQPVAPPPPDPASKVETLPEVTVNGGPASRRPVGPGKPRDPLWEERYARAGGRDPRFAPLGIPITPGEADAAMTRARQVGNLQVEQTEEMIEAGRQMAEADSAAEAMKAGYVEEQARRDRERTDILEGAERNMRSLLDEVTAEPIDSQRHWNSKNTGEKILSSIAVGLGALGSGLTGAPNFAFEKLQSEIKNDIEAQKTNKAFAQSRAMAEGSLIQLARDRFDDERMQDLSMQQAAWNLADKELERFGTLVKAPAQQTAIEEMRTKIAAEQETLGREFRTALDSYALERIAARQRALAAGQKKPKKPPRTEVKNLLSSIGTQDALIGKLRRAKDLTSSWIDRVPGTKERAKAETLMTGALFDVKNAAQLGALSGPDMDLIISYLGKPADLFRGPGSESKLDQAIQLAEASKAQALRQYQDLQETDTGPDPRGSRTAAQAPAQGEQP